MAMIRRFGAAAALSLCASVGAHAQSVTLYGIIDTGVQYAHTGGTSVSRVESSSVAPSRWGMIGTEDLGGGLAAVFKLEDGFNVNNGTIAGNGALFNREAWVGLRSNSWGQVQVGNNYTPLFTTYVTYSQGDLNTLGWGNATNNFVFVPVARTANSIRYVSPVFAGLTVRALYARGANGAAGQPRTLGDTASVGFNFKVGQFSADADYLQQRFTTTSTVTTASPTGTGRYYLFGASYDFGFVKPAFLYQMHRNTDSVTTASNAAYANPENDFYEINALVPNLANGTLLLSFGQYRLRGNSSGNALSYGVRYDYFLSKRTGLYAGASYVKNKANAAFTINNAGGAGIPVTAGNNIVSFIAGIVHRF